MRQKIEDKPLVGVLTEFLTEKQVSIQLGRSVRTLRLWRAEGHGPDYTTIGREVLYRRTGIAAWLESLETKVVAAALPHSIAV